MLIVEEGEIYFLIVRFCPEISLSLRVGTHLGESAPVRIGLTVRVSSEYRPPEISRVGDEKGHSTTRRDTDAAGDQKEIQEFHRFP